MSVEPTPKIIGYGTYADQAPAARLVRPAVAGAALFPQAAVRSAGAYGFVMANTYNQRALPREVVIDD